MSGRKGVLDTFPTQNQAEAFVVELHDREVNRGAASLHASPGYARIANLGWAPNEQDGVEIITWYVPITGRASGSEYDVTEQRETIDPREFRVIRQLMAEAERKNAKQAARRKDEAIGPLAAQFDIVGEAQSEGWTHTKAMALVAVVQASDAMAAQLAETTARAENLEKQLQRLRDEFRRHLRETREGSTDAAGRA